jgi:hypothetical protein
MGTSKKTDRSSVSMRVEAAAQALKLAERHGIRAWLRIDDGSDFVPLGTDAMRTIQDVFTRLHAEFQEMPGLQLTSAQVQRLCGIEPTLCRLVLDLLVSEEFLCVTADGRYTRMRDGVERVHLHLAKVVLRTHQHAKKAS